MKLPALYIIGSGNLAWQLAQGLTAANIAVSGIIARNSKEGKKLSKQCNCTFFKSTEEVSGHPSLFFICVSDDAIDEIQQQIKNIGATIIHCSGMHPMIPAKALLPHQHAGVFYPVQSFNKKPDAEWNKIPVCIEAGDRKTLLLLQRIARKFTGPQYQMDSSTRAIVHLAAVFANNFSNAQFAIAHQVLQMKNIPFDILKPLILRTSAKVQTANPEDVQTGPAKRRDAKTISAHKKLLREQPELGKIYADLTRFIERHFPD